MRSRIFEGDIHHRRKDPVEHQFGFRSFFFYLDLDELDSVFGNNRLYAVTKRSFARFRYSDHLAHAEFDSKTSFRQAVLDVLRDHGVEREIGPICLLTQLRYLGFVMNPVSFYYCFDHEGGFVEAIVAEVNNTPWGEQHLYVIDRNVSSRKDFGESVQTVVAKRINKDFHVSPFMEMDMHYDMKFTISGDMETNSIPANEALPTRLGVKITNFQQGVKIFDVAMSLKSKPITPTSLWLTLFKYPLISWKVFAGIYWQAARLYWKKVPFVAHPGKRQKESQQPGISQSDDRSATANSESLTNEESETVLAGQ